MHGIVGKSKGVAFGLPALIYNIDKRRQADLQGKDN
jgi:hypothetical protein